MPSTVHFQLEVHYGFVYLQAGDGLELPDLHSARAGQQNGICGAAVPGVLSMLTGLHTGPVPFTVEVHDAEPPVGDDWEDVVEVSVAFDDEELTLSSFQQFEEVRLPAPGTYRARYCAHGADAGREQDTRMDDDPVVDRYLLAMWPAPPAPERVVRQGSEFATYWAGVAAKAKAPEPPPPPPPVEPPSPRPSLVERLQWHGVEPTARVRAFGPVVAVIAEHDMELAELIATADPATQRAVAIWCAHRACVNAGDRGIDWQPALDAVEAGRALPAPFDGFDLVHGQDDSDAPAPRALQMVVRSVPFGERVEHRAIDTVAAALATLRAGQLEDPDTAAIQSLSQAASGMADRDAFYAEARAFYRQRM